MHSLGKDQVFWDELARRDPLWAILSDPTKRGRRWDLATFFKTGEREISTLLHQLDGLPGGRPRSIITALDFGCGVGRLTQALARSFERVVGVDVSAVMLDHARRLNRFGERVSYLLNDREDLSILGAAQFDLVYTDLVLQHMPPARALGYIAEFIRLLRPAGMAIFQLPSERRDAFPALVVPMKDEDYRAVVELVAAPTLWRAGGTERIDLRVTNGGCRSWDQSVYGVMRVGNHWLSSAGEMLVQDDGRAMLPSPLGPAQDVVLGLDVTVPRGTDTLILEFDVVHEGHSWFGDKGSPTNRLEVRVGGGMTGQSLFSTGPSMWTDEDLAPFLTAAPDPDVAFPMYGVPQQEVIDFVRAGGCEVVLAESDDRGGDEWRGFRYFVRKPDKQHASRLPAHVWTRRPG